MVQIANRKGEKIMSNPTILFYNLDNETGRRLKLVCLKHKIRIKTVEKSQYALPIGCIAGLLPDTSSNNSDASPQEIPASDFSDEMLVFCHFTNALLDTFLLEFKKNRIPRIALKAVLTEQNIYWNSYVLHEELKREHEQMTTTPQQ